MNFVRNMLSAVLVIYLGGLNLLLLGAQTVPPISHIQPLSSVSASRLAHLRHGINASEWFAQVYDQRGYTKEHFQTWTTTEDIALIKSMGFDHVRLSVNPQPMMPNHRPEEIPAEYFGYLDAAVKMIRDYHLDSTINKA